MGLRSTQFTILQVLSQAGEVSQGKLAEMLVMDSTTLTRTLSIMIREKWIAERRGDEDRRERWLRLSKSGSVQLNRALPVWEEVQSRLRNKLGEQAWITLLQLTHQLTHLVTKEGESS